MPLYEYVCQKCGRKTEIIQRHRDKPLTHCPNCGGKVKKAISAPAIQFKGSGFYLTDYGRAGSGGGKKEAGEGSGAEKAAEKADAPKAEKKESSGKSEKSEKSEKSGKSEKKAAKGEG